MATRKKAKPRRNPSSAGKAAPTKRAARKLTTRRVGVPKPVGRRTDKNRRVADIVMRFITEMRKAGGFRSGDD